MEIKITPKLIQVEAYVTSDGIEFTEKDDALIHEKKIKAESIFKITESDIMNSNDLYVIVKSLEDANLLYDYIHDVCDCCCTIEDNPNYITYPALLSYTQDCYLKVVEDTEYRRCKQLCSMFEEVLSIS